MYFPDLSPYTYWEFDSKHPTLNVGWLDNQHTYPVGEVDTLFLERLWIYCKSYVHLTLGYHNCEFCNEDLGISIQRDGRYFTLGSAEIRVIGTDGITYAAPNMIYHYIVDHHYLPPQSFIQAVLESPLPHESAEYQRRYGNA